MTPKRSKSPSKLGLGSPIEISSYKPQSVVVEVLSSDSEPDPDDFYLDADEDMLHELDQEVLATFGGEKRKAEAVPEENESAQSLSPASKRQKLPVRVKEMESSEGHRKVQVEIPIPVGWQAQKEERVSASKSEDVVEDDNEGFKTPVTTKSSGHIRFDDGEPDQFYTPLEGPARNPLDLGSSQNETAMDADEESEDDGPPEAVSTSKAAAESLKSSQMVAKATELQAATQKRRRQERDTLLKAQSEARKRAFGEIKHGQLPDQAGVSLSEPQPNDGVEKPAGGRQRVDKKNIPALLPAELLESDDEHDDDLTASGPAQRPKKITFAAAERNLARQTRPPKDRRVGSTIYKVTAGKEDEKLAPKLKKHSRHMKQQLLARSRVGIQSGGGFFVKRQ